ncbi:hypothetical protein LCGC14_2446210 [marine sediment metagenome]|uniref:Uncharacterized protein n=1 Tax=marine sediment metagenome TaxID=412755 RepID=A0A0F9DUM2_9ZZZZ
MGHNYWIGKRAKLEIFINEKTLFYTAIIIECDETFISFKDKFGETKVEIERFIYYLY